jgi:hypothetical protein
LQVSERTVYRDLAELARREFGLEGEAGLDYVLKPGFSLPRRPTFSRRSMPAISYRIHQMPEPGTFSKRPRSFFAIFLGIIVLVEVILAKVKNSVLTGTKTGTSPQKT